MFCLVLALVFAIILLALVVCLCLYVIGAGSSSNARHSDPSRDTSSKRLRNQEAPKGSSAPQRHVKTTATKIKEPTVGMDEMPQAESMVQRKLNPYIKPRELSRGNDLFWTKQQYLIFLDVIKAKQNTYVPVQWIDMNHTKKDNSWAYFGEPLDMVEQFGIEELLTFHMDFDPKIVA